MNEQFTIILQKPWTIPTAVGVLAFSGGVGLGYILGKRRRQKALGELVLIKNDQLEEYSEIVDHIERRTEELQGLTDELKDMTVVELKEPLDEVPDVVVVVEPDDDWNYEVELSMRKPDVPYTIHRDEFFEDSMGYTQATLTYYQGDDILTDELDVPIYGHSALTGNMQFGHGSGDPNVVYIRNEEREDEYEILRHYGRYEVEVLGHEIDQHYKDEDLKHSNVRKFKLD